MIRAVGFDLDDTLFDHAGAVRTALAAWCARHGLATADAEHLESALDRIHFPLSPADRLTGIARLLGALGETGREGAQLEQLATDYLVAYREAWRAFPDAAPAVAAAKEAGLRVGVLTNGEAATQRAKLSGIGLLAEFEAVLCSSELPAGKPAATAYQRLAAELGVQVGELGFTGDDLRNDFHGPKAAGAKAVLLDRSGRHGAHHQPVVAGLAELLPVLLR